MAKQQDQSEGLTHKSKPVYSVPSPIYTPSALLGEFEDGSGGSLNLGLVCEASEPSSEKSGGPFRAFVNLFKDKSTDAAEILNDVITPIQEGFADAGDTFKERIVDPVQNTVSDHLVDPAKNVLREQVVEPFGEVVEGATRVVADAADIANDVITPIQEGFADAGDTLNERVFDPLKEEIKERVVEPLIGAAEASDLSAVDQIQETEVTSDAALETADAITGSSIQRSMRSVESGSTLWQIAQEELGDGSRWAELQKVDGSTFSIEESRNLAIGTEVYVPGGQESDASINIAGGEVDVESPALENEGLEDSTTLEEPEQPELPAISEAQEVTSDSALETADAITGSSIQRSMRSVESGSTLWQIAQEELGDGSRWAELQKADGSTFSIEESRNLAIGTEVYVPGGQESDASINIAGGEVDVESPALENEGLEDSTTLEETEQPELPAISADSDFYRSTETNPFAARYQGQCTWFSYGRMLETGLMPDNVQASNAFLGNAGTWEADAQRLGLNVVDKPEDGKSYLMVFPPNVKGAGEVGHVAFLEDVLPGGDIRISESNWDNQGIAEREIESGNISGIKFVELGKR